MITPTPEPRINIEQIAILLVRSNDMQRVGDTDMAQCLRTFASLAARDLFEGDVYGSDVVEMEGKG